LARITPIRITRNDKEEYRRLAGNAKAKIRRTKKNHGIDLSSEVNIPTIDDFQTRKEFNQWKKDIQWFTNRSNLNFQFVTNDYGVTASKAQINRIKRNTKTAQDQAEKEIEKLKKSDAYKDQQDRKSPIQQQIGMIGESGVLGVRVPNDFNFDNVPTQQRLNDLDKRMKDRAEKGGVRYFDERKQRMRDNFIESIEGSFHSAADELITELRKLNPNDFYELYWMFFRDFDFALYDSEGQQVNADEGKIDVLLSHISDYRNDRVNKDLTGF